MRIKVLLCIAVAMVLVCSCGGKQEDVPYKHQYIDNEDVVKVDYKFCRMEADEKCEAETECTGKQHYLWEGYREECMRKLGYTPK